MRARALGAAADLPRNLSPIEKLEKARAERHERAAEKERATGGGASPTQSVEDISSPQSDGQESSKSAPPSAYKGPPVRISTEKMLLDEKKLEKEAGRRLSMAGFDPELAKLSAEHPMLDQRRSSVVGGTDGEIKRMVGILIWRT